MKALFLLLAIGGIGVWGVSALFAKAQEYYYSKPWFSGTQVQIVCKVPYYTNNDCYSLPVTVENGKVTTIGFPNGGYITGEGECTRAASGVGYNFSRFCSLNTSTLERWDIFPPGSNVK